MAHRYVLRHDAYGRGNKCSSLAFARQELRAAVGGPWRLVERSTGRVVADEADAHDDAAWAAIVAGEQ